ncbi:hypothetical protein D3C87_2039250 [compost metagenome]
MVLRGEHHVFHTGTFGGLSPTLGVEFNRVEGFGNILVSLFILIPVVRMRPAAFAPAFVLRA